MMLIPSLVLVAASSPWYAAPAEPAPPAPVRARQVEAGGETRFGEHGFAVSSPVVGWEIQAGRATDEGFRVEVVPRERAGLVGVSVTSAPATTGTTSEAARDGGLASAAARPEYRGHDTLDGARLAGAPAAGLVITWETSTSGTFTIQQRYVVVGERVLMAQAYAPADEWESHRPDFERILGTVRSLEPSSAERREATVAELASRCGGEADWAESWDDAARRAGATGRHVLVVMRAYSGFDLPDSTRMSTFMDEDVLAMVDTRLVPVRLGVDSPSPLQDRAVYGLSPTVLGVALILMRSDGTLIADTPHGEPAAVLHWLRTELAREPEPGEPAWPEDPLAAASLALDRGELERAAAWLAPLESARAHVERARLHRLHLDGEAALSAWRRAVQLEPTLDAEVACDMATVLALDGDGSAAASLLASLVSDRSAADHPRALFLVSMLAQSELGLDAARPLRRRLVRTHPDSRWAWLAAAYLQLEPLLRAVDDGVAPTGPRPEVLAIMAEPPAAPLAVHEAARAERDALEWLLEHQRDDGSWPGPDELNRSRDRATDAITTAVDALATRALIQRGDDCRAAAERGLAFLLANDARRRAKPEPVVYMDYTAWAAWAQLELIADALDAGLGEPADLRALAARLVDDLAARVRRNGGWSYYLSGDAAGENAVEQSISFTTAAAIVGLTRARGQGVPVPTDLVEGALDCLQGMRGDDGLFAYMVHHPGGAETRSAAPGAAGRGPACEFALRAGERGSSGDVERALDLFDEHADSLAAEVGKALMHAGADTQGCHYPFFDYLMAARALGQLRPRDRRRYRNRLTELVLSARLADGSFLDTPVIGPTFGTAAALLAFDALRR